MDNVCSHYLNGSCGFGAKCKKIHPTEQQVFEFMAANGFDGAFDDQNYGAEDMEEYKENEIEETKGEP